MTLISTVANVPTEHGSRYLQQLLKHWSHTLAVELSPLHGTVVFPRNARGADYAADALATFDATDDTLQVRIDASSDVQVEVLKGVIAQHLDRFAFREAPLAFDWTATPG